MKSRAACAATPLAAAILALALASVPRAAHAAACCGESHGLGERLASAERAAITSSIRMRGRVGAWNSEGGTAWLAEGDYDRELRADLGWLVRVSRSFQLGASVPFFATWRRLGTSASFGGGPGDVSALARFDAVPPSGRGAIPGIAMTLAATIPTGRSPFSSSDVTGADVTGIGVAELRPGVALEKQWMSGWYVLGLATVGARFPVQVGEHEVALSPRWQIAVLGGHTFSNGFGVGFGNLFEYEEGPSIDGARAPRSARQRLAALAVAAYDVDPRWTLLASLQGDLPVARLGRNEPIAVSGSLGLRFVWGDRD